MAAPFVWYLTITALGWLAFPIAYRLLPGLPDRGYSLSRALGLLIWGYLFWLLASLGALRNDTAGLVFAAVLLGGLSLWALLGLTPAELGGWLRRRAGMIVAAEALFALAFGAWCLVRAANPEALGTEKPMELAFINAILRSPTFPPHDPWLSGYAISYYYFGYVLVAMLAQMTGTPGALAFNLGGTLVFGLGAVGAYGVVYNLLNAGRPAADRPRFSLAALFGPLYLLLVSNWEGFLEVLHSRGLFWQTAPGGGPTSAFWRWLDIKDLTLPPASAPSWAPTRYYWWWRASRVVQDYDLAGNPREIIDEFPFFSFLLADLHPHVLAIPFGLLAVGLALNLFLGGGRSPGGPRRARLSAEMLVTLAMAGGPVSLLLIGLGLWKLRLSLALGGLLLAGLSGAAYAWGSGRKTHPEPWLEFELPLRPAVFGLCALALGGLAFLNTWDYPLYVALAAAAFAWEAAGPNGRTLKRLAARFFCLGLLLGISGILLYLPFYLSFSSQAGGVIPNLVYPTRGAHLWIMFGPLLIPIFVFLLYEARQTKPSRTGLKMALAAAAGGGLTLWLASLALGLLAANLPGSLSEVSQLFKASIAAGDARQLFIASVLRRLTQPGGWITLLALAAGAAALTLYGERPTSADDPPAAVYRPPSVVVFVALLILGGALMVTGPEFFFLRDLFGSRMNTIFKFYYQAWLVWSLAAAYATVVLLGGLRGGWRMAVGLLLGLSLAAGLAYPPLSLWNKTNGFNPPEWTLDSTAYLARSNPAEMQAIAWLGQAPAGVVAEAGKGDAYSDYGRAATLSGQPGVMGWINHENQWRGEGSAAAIGTRPADLKLLYCTRSWEEAQAVVERYNIRYIFVGGLERAAYTPSDPACPLGLVEAKFVRNLHTAFQAGDVTIYEYSTLASRNPLP